ncbi:DUF3306 domain-containing protein [Prosthecodimorpha staleyi]|uniref:DUF3306 domain-containing protein n=1 Tax=Prosthecodimorpha staleyi TaxID=2840188 RepID=A0A947GCD0_9HYPH|nr:DUF3306 domain-containing protein [Prosthecodimorpha staleyi]MBT9289056.1 DUF3306 domain-containing protein [Prosthecodimorpha staleyi]
MSPPDPASFLERWSRRKRAVARGEPPVDQADEALPPAPAGGAASAVPAADDRTGIVDAAGPEAGADPVPDLSDLPSLDAITAETDMSLFLRRHVPDDLRNAALRRAWSADPVISTFVEMADYAWDFNTPEGNPVYGPLSAAVDAGKMAADILGIGMPEKTGPASLPEAEGSPATDAMPSPAGQRETVPDVDSVPDGRAGEGGDAAGIRSETAGAVGSGGGTAALDAQAPRGLEPCDARSQVEAGEKDPQIGTPIDFGRGATFGGPAHGAPVPLAARRRHGGALPAGDS